MIRTSNVVAISSLEQDMVTLGAVFKPSSDRSGDRGGDRISRTLDRRGSRRLLVGEIPLQMERLRSVSSRSIGSANRSHSNRSQSTAGMTEDIVDGASSVRSTSRASSPAPPGALSPLKGSHNTGGLSSSSIQPPMVFQTFRLIMMIWI